jgi:hypothetical protein
MQKFGAVGRKGREGEARSVEQEIE